MRRAFFVIVLILSSVGFAEVKSAQAVTAIFHTYASSGALTDADSLPTGALYIDGTAHGASVTVTNITTGTYKAAVTCPALTAGQFVQMRVAATISSISTADVVWEDFADTARVSDTWSATSRTLTELISGTGADVCTINVKVGGVNLPGATVWITTDAAGAVDSGAGVMLSNTSGNCKARLTAGATYYLWMIKTGYTSIQGEAFVAVAD